MELSEKIVTYKNKCYVYFNTHPYGFTEIPLYEEDIKGIIETILYLLTVCGILYFIGTEVHHIEKGTSLGLDKMMEIVRTAVTIEDKQCSIDIEWYEEKQRELGCFSH